MNKSRLTRCRHGCHKLTIVNGNELLFRGCSRPDDAAEFTVQNELTPDDIGKTEELDGKPYEVAAHGGTAAVRVAPDGSYTITGRALPR